MNTQPVSTEQEAVIKGFNDKYLKSVAQAYPDFQDSHSILLADIKKFMLSEIEIAYVQGQKDALASVRTANSGRQMYQAGVRDGKAELLGEILKLQFPFFEKENGEPSESKVVGIEDIKSLAEKEGITL